MFGNVLTIEYITSVLTKARGDQKNAVKEMTKKIDLNPDDVSTHAAFAVSTYSAKVWLFQGVLKLLEEGKSEAEIKDETFRMLTNACSSHSMNKTTWTEQRRNALCDFARDYFN